MADASCLACDPLAASWRARSRSESERIQDDHREFCAEVVEFIFAPAAIQARGAGDVFGKSLAVVALANEDVADEASGVDVVDAAAGLAAGIGQAEKDFADASELGAVVPGLRRVDLGMMALGAVVRGF